MTESIENIVLEHLCYIRRSMDELHLDIADLKTRVTAIEITTAQIVLCSPRRVVGWTGLRTAWPVLSGGLS